VWWRTALAYALGVTALAALLVLEGVPPRQLPLWLAVMVAIGFVVERSRRQSARTSRSIKISGVAIVDESVLAVQREGQAPRAYRLRDGGELATAGVDVVAPDPRHDVALATQATYGDIARLWLEGDRRRALHGLQPQPATPLEVVRGEFVVTKQLLAEPTEPLPILLFHVPSLDEPVAELLTLVALDGAVRWQVAFPAAMIRRARQLFVTPELVVFVLGKTPGIYRYGDTIRHAGDEPPEAVALDRATGAVVWRAEI
jgi:hypothetical protein